MRSLVRAMTHLQSKSLEFQPHLLKGAHKELKGHRPQRQWKSSRNLRGRKRKKLRHKLWKICRRSPLIMVIPQKSTIGPKLFRRSLFKFRSQRGPPRKWWTSRSNRSDYLWKLRVKINHSSMENFKRKLRLRILSGVSRTRNLSTSHLKKLTRPFGRQSFSVTRR